MKMLHCNFQINLIFGLCIIAEVNYVISQEIGTTNKVYFKAEKCVNNNCCEDFRKLPANVVCKKATDINYIYFPNDFPRLENTYDIEFTDTKLLAGSIFQEKHVRAIVLDDPDVTVDNNVLEGIVALDDFIAKRSSIKVIIIKLLELLFFKVYNKVFFNIFPFYILLWIEWSRGQ